MYVEHTLRGTTDLAKDVLLAALRKAEAGTESLTNSSGRLRLKREVIYRRVLPSFYGIHQDFLHFIKVGMGPIASRLLEGIQSLIMHDFKTWSRASSEYGASIVQILEAMLNKRLEVWHLRVGCL